MPAPDLDPSWFRVLLDVSVRDAFDGQAHDGWYVERTRRELRMRTALVRDAQTDFTFVDDPAARLYLVEMVDELTFDESGDVGMEPRWSCDWASEWIRITVPVRIADERLETVAVRCLGRGVEVCDPASLVVESISAYVRNRIAVTNGA